MQLNYLQSKSHEPLPEPLFSSEREPIVAGGGGGVVWIPEKISPLTTLLPIPEFRTYEQHIYPTNPNSETHKPIRVVQATPLVPR